LGLEAFDHVPVVHDLVAHVDGRAVLLQRALHDLDRAHDAGAETARLSKNQPHSTASMSGIMLTVTNPCPGSKARFGARNRPISSYGEGLLSSRKIRNVRKVSTGSKRPGGGGEAAL